MSIEVAMAEQRVKDMRDRIHHFCSQVGNALERISINIDEEEVDEAKRELAQLRDELSRIADNA